MAPMPSTPAPCPRPRLQLMAPGSHMAATTHTPLPPMHVSHGPVAPCSYQITLKGPSACPPAPPSPLSPPPPPCTLPMSIAWPPCPRPPGTHGSWPHDPTWLPPPTPHRCNQKTLNYRNPPHVEGFGFTVYGLGFGFRFRVSGFGFRVSGFGFGVWGLGFRVGGRRHWR